MLKVNAKAYVSPKVVEKLLNLPKYKDSLFEGGYEISTYILAEFGLNIAPGTINSYFRENRMPKHIIRKSLGYKHDIIGLRENVLKFLKNNQIEEETNA
jgi:hypothetical protein